MSHMNPPTVSEPNGASTPPLPRSKRNEAKVRSVGLTSATGLVVGSVRRDGHRRGRPDSATPMRIAPSPTVIAVYAHSWVVVCTSGPRAIPGSTSARLPCAARSWTISPPMPGPSSWSLFEPATHDVEELVGFGDSAALRHSGCSLRIVGHQHLSHLSSPMSGGAGTINKANHGSGYGRRIERTS